MTKQRKSTQMIEDVIRFIRALAKEEELPEHLATAAISPEDTVEILGLDSLGAVSLIERIEEELDISLPDDFLDIGDDITGIASRINAIVQLEDGMVSTGSGASQEAIKHLRVPSH
jgi:acyl carrier protein